MSDTGRRALLETHGRTYATLGLAVCWTVGLNGDDGKRVMTREWQKTPPLTEPEFAAGLFAQRGQTRNPAITARTSGLILLDCDTQAGLDEIGALSLPATWTVQSSLAHKRHYYFRAPSEQPVKVGFRWENDGFSADLNRYLVAPPALPSGRVYAFLPTLTPWEIEAAELPRDVYEELLRRGAAAELKTEEKLHDSAGKVTEGGRNRTVFKYASQQRRWETDPQRIIEAAYNWNLAHCAPPLTEAQVAHQVAGAMKLQGGQNLGGGSSPPQLAATPIAEVLMRSIEWREKPTWQRSAFQLFAGAKGSGKGTYLAGLASRLSRGGDNVLFVSSEDSAEIDLKPRLVAAGADVNKCFVIRQHVRLPDDVAQLRTLAGSLGGVGLLVVDPVANHIGDRNANSDAEVRDAIAPLNQLANDLDCLVIGVRHPGKDRSRGAVASILGSTAWVDTPRAVVMIAVDDIDPQLRHIQVVAGNRAPNGAAQAFRIDAVDVPGLTEPITVAVALGESEKSVDDLLAARGDRGDNSKTAAARELMLDVLEDDGEQESDTLAARVAQGSGLAVGTVRNIRTALKDEGLLKVFPEKDQFGSITSWRVARSAAPRT